MNWIEFSEYLVSQKIEYLKCKIEYEKFGKWKTNMNSNEEKPIKMDQLHGHRLCVNFISIYKNKWAQKQIHKKWQRSTDRKALVIWITKKSTTHRLYIWYIHSDRERELNSCG